MPLAHIPNVRLCGEQMLDKGPTRQETCTRKFRQVFAATYMRVAMCYMWRYWATQPQ